MALKIWLIIWLVISFVLTSVGGSDIVRLLLDSAGVGNDLAKFTSVMCGCILGGISIRMHLHLGYRMEFPELDKIDKNRNQ